jgi:hypothetical protein
MPNHTHLVGPPTAPEQNQARTFRTEEHNRNFHLGPNLFHIQRFLLYYKMKTSQTTYYKNSWAILLIQSCWFGCVIAFINSVGLYEKSLHVKTFRNTKFRQKALWSSHTSALLPPPKPLPIDFNKVKGESLRSELGSLIRTKYPIDIRQEHIQGGKS